MKKIKHDFKKMYSLQVNYTDYLYRRMRDKDNKIKYIRKVAYGIFAVSFIAGMIVMRLILL